MHVQIFSMMGAIAGNEQTVWSGEISLGHTGDYEATNDLIFRFFNRVDQDDCNRLDNIGYRMPSLSMGDYFTYHEHTFMVAPLGFEQVTGNHDLLLSRLAKH